MRFAVLAMLLLAVCSPALMAQSDHVEVGAFVDYFNLSRTSPHINYVGLGGRVGFNVNPNVQIEAEMAYDFDRNFTSLFSDGVDTEFVRSRTRTLHGLFGPKFQTSRGPFRAFATFKAGFINFSTTNQNVPDGFVGALGGVTDGNTRAAIYPGVGVEGFWGPFGLRLDGGDEIYFDHGARNNVRVTFGPVFRF
jgi:Outer membrane protein beta-barrel domain